MFSGDPPFYALCIVLFSLFVHTCHTATLETEWTIERSNKLPVDYLRYGLLQNATMFIHLETEDDELLYLLVCSEEDYYVVHEDTQICDEVEAGYKRCEIMQPFQRSLRLYYYFPDFGEYYFSLLRCSELSSPIQLLVHLELENPNGNHLPSALVPAPTMYVLVAVLWAIVLAVWIVAAAPKRKNISPLQYAMLSYPLLKVIASAICAQYFYLYQRHEDDPLYLWIVYRAFLIVVLLDFHYILLILSKAWSISGNLDKSDYHLMFSMLVGLCCSLMFKYYYDDSDLAFLLASLAYIGLRVMILACVFININHTIGRLESEMLNYNAELENVNIRPTVVKLHKIFVLIKFALMLWVILNVAEFFCNILFFGGTELNWIDMMNTEFIDFLFSLCIGILLLPHVSLQITIASRARMREAPALNEAENSPAEENEDIERASEDGATIRPSEPRTNEHGELELTTFASTSARSTFSPISPLLTPESPQAILFVNGIGAQRSSNYQKVEYEVEDEESSHSSDDEVELVDKRRVHVQ